jgi:integrase
MPIRSHKGKLFIDFRYQDTRCREYSSFSDTPENRQRFELLEKRIRDEIEAGTFNYAHHFPHSKKAQKFQKRRRLLFSEFTQTWLSHRSPFLEDGSLNIREIKPSTWKTDSIAVKRYLAPAFGHFYLDQVTTAAALEFRERLKKTALSNKRINNIMGILRKVLSDAKLQGHISHNPITGIPALKRTTKSKSAPLTPREVALFLSKVDPYYLNYYIVAFSTGMRPGELCALKWESIDFKRQEITIERHIIRGLETPGGKTGTRVITCKERPIVFKALTRQRQRTGHKSPYVFIGKRDGGPLNYEHLHSKVWLPALQRCSLAARDSYNTKDTFISIALSAGEDIGWIANSAGTSEQMIFKHYRKWIPNLIRRDGMAIKRVLEKWATVAQKAVKARKAPA